jgi:hypothetical protein
MIFLTSWPQMSRRAVKIALKKEAESFFETLVSYHNPEDLDWNLHRRENLKSRICISCYFHKIIQFREERRWKIQHKFSFRAWHPAFKETHKEYITQLKV